MGVVVLEPAGKQLEDGSDIRQRRDIDVVAPQRLHVGLAIDDMLRVRGAVIFALNRSAQAEQIKS